MESYLRRAHISYAPRLKAAVPRTRNGPEMVPFDQVQEETPQPENLQATSGGNPTPGETSPGTHPGTTSGLRNRSAAPGDRPARPTRGDTTVTTPPRGTPGKHSKMNTPFALKETKLLISQTHNTTLFSDKLKWQKYTQPIS